MSYRTPVFRYTTLLKLGVLLVILMIPFTAAQAYVGPGAGLSLLSALWGLICAIGAAFLFIIQWPLRRMLRKRREARQARESSSSQTSNQSQHADTNPKERGKHR